MLQKIFQKVIRLADHHQAMFALIVTLCFILLGWGVEKLLETYLFPKKPVYGYIFAVIVGLALLWLTQHYILHVI